MIGERSLGKVTTEARPQWALIRFAHFFSAVRAEFGALGTSGHAQKKANQREGSDPGADPVDRLYSAAGEVGQGIDDRARAFGPFGAILHALHSRSNPG